MKKTMLMFLVLLAVLSSSTLAETNWLVIGENGLVYDRNGAVIGATADYEEWVHRQHEAGLTTSAVAFRPVTVRAGVVYEDRTGKALGRISDRPKAVSDDAAYVGQLGDTALSVVCIGALAASALAGAVFSRGKRTCIGR